jgi:hypothetical protein
MSEYFIKQHGKVYYESPKTNRSVKAVDKPSPTEKESDDYSKSSTKVIVKRYAVK